jgi:molecular chaperone GrpE
MAWKPSQEPPKADRPAEPAAANDVGQDRQAAETQPQPDVVESLRAELAAAKDRMLRTQAELDNFRKRVEREMADHRRYAELPLLRDLLPVLDNVHRAIEAAEKTPGAPGLLEGVKLVAEQLENVLQRHHSTRINAENAPFDPNIHEAIGHQPSGQHPANTVMLVARPGFQLHDRVVRPSQVIVSSGPPPAAPSE